jgi:hypothetical protein
MTANLLRQRETSGPERNRGKSAHCESFRRVLALDANYLF